jgi:hypothetical protein
MDYSPQIQTSSYFYGCRKFATDGMSVQRIKGSQISIGSPEPAGKHYDVKLTVARVQKIAFFPLFLMQDTPISSEKQGIF